MADTGVTADLNGSLKPRAVAPAGMPAPLGLYSHAVAVPLGAQLVTIAGQLAVDAAGEPITGDFGDQFRTVIRSLDTVLRSIGADLTAVCKFTTYLIDPDDIAGFYEERAKVWPAYWPDGGAPANTLLVVQRLVRPEFRIEIEAIAAVPPLEAMTQ